ncbi:MAG: hypothetical protein M1835_000292 [Candelina submexicana]|nr:MAG: hypothetical protein M1835_000292 [Candelina submexicana]
MSKNALSDLRNSDAANPSYPEPFIINPTSTHTHTIILLHGRGGKGQSFGTKLILSKISSGGTLQKRFPGFKWIFPTARKRRARALNNATIHQWFDMPTLRGAEIENKAWQTKERDLGIDGLSQGVAYLHELMRQELASVPEKNLFLGGLSQGCAIGLHCLLTFDRAIGGFVGMSGWFPLRSQVDDMLNDGDIDQAISFCNDEHTEVMGPKESPATAAIAVLKANLDLTPSCPAHAEPTPLGTPVFLGHGDADKKVECKLGEQAADLLRRLGMSVMWKVYKDFGHWYKVPDETDDIITFLQHSTSVGTHC